MSTPANQNVAWNPLRTDDRGAVHTTSSIRAWILVTYYRYEVAKVALVPRSTLLGWTHCQRTWTLTPAKRT